MLGVYNAEGLRPLLAEQLTYLRSNEAARAIEYTFSIMGDQIATTL